MEQRVNDEALGYYQDARQYYAGLLMDLVDDLVEARAEIATLLKEYRRLQAVSESQAEALDAAKGNR